MRVLAWLRASQAVLLEASAVPACVGTAAAIHGGSPFVPLYFVLILASLLSIQAGANLFKGYYEAADRRAPPASAGSWLAFDSGAAVGLTRDPRSVLRTGWALMIIGIGTGLLLVALTSSLLLLALGAAGFLLAWSYSAPPLKLSYRGLGEISTFLAFGPVMTAGATVAFGTRGIVPSLLASLVLGFLAAAISFVRYFPNEAEDRAKGKRTPVTVLGVPASVSVLMGLWWAPLAIFVAWAAVPFLIAAMVHLPRAVRGSTPYQGVIGLTILAHLAAGLGLAVAFLS
jgi:1,4-dihydroxy-2-naphthoate octaprenyltransferase